MDYEYSHPADKECGPHYDNLAYQPELVSRLDRSWPNPKKQSIVSGNTYSNYDDMPADYNNKIISCKKLMIILGIILLLIGIISGIVMAIYFSNRRTETETDETIERIEQKVFVAQIKIDEEFTPALANMSSPEAQERAQQFENTMDTVYKNSALADTYNGTEVTGFSNGSVIVTVSITFVIVVKVKPQTPGSGKTPPTVVPQITINATIILKVLTSNSSKTILKFNSIISIKVVNPITTTTTTTTKIPLQVTSDATSSILLTSPSAPTPIRGFDSSAPTSSLSSTSSVFISLPDSTTAKDTVTGGSTSTTSGGSPATPVSGASTATSASGASTATSASGASTVTSASVNFTGTSASGGLTSPTASRDFTATPVFENFTQPPTHTSEDTSSWYSSSSPSTPYSGVSDTTPMVTTSPQVDCGLGMSPCNTNNQCINENWICDRIVDCKDGSDENQKVCNWNDTKPTIEPEFPNGTELNCNFEGPGRRLCNYQTSNGSYIWNIQQGPTQSNSTGPNFDHSYQDENGNYIFTESSYGNFMDNASLMSDFIMTHNNTSSLSFYYHMYGQEMGSLSVYFDIRENGQMKRELQWTKSGDNGNYWMKACLLLPRKTVLRVSFIASHGRLHTSDIALDDIEYSLEHCQKLPCTFEDSMCGEVMSPTVQLPDKYSWHLQRSITMWKMAEALGLMGDHSMGTKFARYLVANSSEGSVNDKTMYRTPDFLNENKASLSFRYFINGKDVDRLTVNIRYNNSLVSKTWYKNMNNSQSWHRGCLPVTGKSGAYAEFVAFHGNGSDGMIAVDDIVLLKSPSCNEIFDCEFGNELFCSFKISGDKYRWKMHHSIKGNFIEATGENIEGLKTMLTSQTLTPGPNDSITLKYFMEGSVSLYLNVIEMNQDGKEIIKTLWTGNSQIKPKALNLSMEINALQINEIMENSQNDRIDWMKVCVPLPSKPLAIQIVSLKRDVVKDSMALKYVSIDNEICKVGLMKTNCSFSEPNMCDYIIDCSINTQYLWQRKTGFESKKLTGPQRDHTTNTTSDHFLQTDASKGRTGDNAQVTFPNIKVSNRSSFRFYYYMYGADTGSLQVYINDKMMWKEQGGKTLFWYMGCVDLPLNTRVNVSFIATRGIGPLGNIAIDDVSISHMPCPPRQIKCSFEDEMMCGYTNLPASQTDNKVMEKDQWFRSNISLKQLSIFKSMFVNDYHLQTRGPARIRSPQMQFSGTNCLQFSYFILIGKGTNITVSAIYKDSAKNEENVFSINNFSWAEWRFGQMNLKSGNVTIEFSVKPYDQKITYTFFAINDVKVIANSCPPMACTNANLWKCTTNDICIPNYKVCDKVEDCADGSDEYGCSNSSKDIRLIDGIETGDKGRLEIYVQGSWGTTYGLQWVEMNAHVACRQLGFRGFSQSVRFGKYHYGIGKLWKVNCFGNETKIQDCNLVSIENNVPHTYDVGLICYNTTCETFKKVCPKHDNDNFTYCLYDDQFCDGDLDCPDGFDEKNCSTCQNNEFHCKNRKCIPQSMHCDGNIDCKDASDEINCLSKDVKGYVSVFHEDKMVPFCADTSNTGLFNTICMNTAQGVLDVSLEGKNVSNGVIAIYNKTAKSVFGSYELSKTSSCTQARIQCNKPECGKREAIHYTKQFIQFGTPAIPSEYPWHALLLSDGRFICGATVYTDHWIITAEHCVVEKGVNYEVVVGITRLQNLASAHKYKVKAVVHHPNYYINTDGIPYSDIALLLLEEMLNFTNSVQPICLPSKVYTKEDDCYLSGWGRNENLISQINLQEAKVIAVDNEECKKYYKIDISIICFKHNYPNMPSCYGDSGGPLVCRNSYGRFELVGVISFGYPLCIAPNGTAAEFVNVLAMRGWIVDKTRCKMHCLIDNQCLHEPEICDGVKHCNDSSDEMPPYCNPSLSCKFGSSFKCGYKNVLSNLWYWLSIIQSTPGITAKPATGGDEETDEFMLVSPKATKGKPAQMESPEFSNISCMSFFYIAHSNSSSTKAFLTVKAKLTNSGKSEVIWNSNNSNLTKETVHWKLAMIYLPINTKSIVFEAYFMNSNNGSFISVDDIQALGKNCKQSCPGNLYRCKNSECIKNSYRCNRIEDCSDGSDEQNCNEVEG